MSVQVLSYLHSQLFAPGQILQLLDQGSTPIDLKLKAAGHSFL